MDEPIEAFVNRDKPSFYEFHDGQQFPPAVAKTFVSTDPKLLARHKSSDSVDPFHKQLNQSLCHRCRCITLKRLRRKERLEHHMTWNSLESCAQSSKCALCVLIWGCATVDPAEMPCRVFLKAPSLVNERFPYVEVRSRSKNSKSTEVWKKSSRFLPSTLDNTMRSN